MTEEQTGAEHERHQLEELRAAKDLFMREDPHSPLPPDARTTFAGLHYYPPNDALRFDLTLDKDVSSEPVEIETTTGGARQYRRAGKIHFEVDGQEATATVFESGDTLFLPIRDATSTTETYPAGRYVEPEMNDDGTVHVNFNYLYNPYCAYDARWSCPIPPVENWLKVPIAAGEKRFQ